MEIKIIEHNSESKVSKGEKMQLIPVGNKVIVKPKGKQEKSTSGIILAGDEEKQDQGKVISVGDGAEVQRFKRGDVLVYQKYGPAEVKLEDEKYVIINIDEILAVIK